MESQALCTASVQFDLNLHPSTTANVMAAVQEQLNKLLLRYVHQLEGVVLSYANLRLLANHGLIHVYFPFFRASVRADVTLFRPRAGQVMVGKVNVLGQDYISLLVLDIFNVTISRAAIRQELAPLQGVEGGCWQSSKHSKHQISATSEVRFNVVKIHDSAQYFGLDGSLQDADTGCTNYLERAARKKRKRAEAAGNSHKGTSEAAAPVMAAAAPAAQAAGSPAGKAAKPLRGAPEHAAARSKGSKVAQPASREDAGAASRQAASMATGHAAEPEQPKKKRRKAAQEKGADAAARQAPAAAAAVVAAEKQAGKHKGSSQQRAEEPQQRAVAAASSLGALPTPAQQNGHEEEDRDPPPKKKKKKHKEAAQINGPIPIVQGRTSSLSSPVPPKKQKKTKPQ